MTATLSLKQDTRDARKFRKALRAGSPAQRKRKALAYLMASGIADQSGRLTPSYR
jgi:hypothetical protein